jgi:Fe-S cluster assembly ATP-binding protein
MGFKEYDFNKGSLVLDSLELKEMDLTQRSLNGIFMAFQNPIEIPGVNYRNFLRIAYNLRQKKSEQLSPMGFKELLLEKAKIFEIQKELLEKNLNENLSGGEKKKLEILQMAVLETRLVILDEIDSGLDFDATKDVYKGLQKIKSQFPQMIFIIITHSLEPFNYLDPSKIIIMKKGSIIKTGGKEILEDIKVSGFSSL